MALRNKSVSILGAGISGLTSAIAMARLGADVIIFERAKKNLNTGAGIQISPNGFGVMSALGLKEALASKGNVLEYINVQNYKKPSFSARVDLINVTHGNVHPHIAIHRFDLINILMKTAVKLGVKILFNKQATGITNASKSVKIKFSDQTYHECQILVGADGIHSLTRKFIGCDETPKFTGKVAWRALIESKFIPLNDIPSEATIRFGPNRHIVTYPIREGKLINLVAVEKREEWTAEGWDLPDNRANLERSFQHWPTDVRKLLSVAENIKLWGLFVHELPNKWHSDMAVLIGDACHPMVPFLGQGANMAIEDAWVLAEELDNSGNILDAFKSFQARRFRRITKVASASSSNGDIYHAVGVRANLINIGMKASYRLKPSFIQSKYDWLYGVDVSRGD